MPARLEPKKLVSITEAADYMGISPKSVRRYIAAGRLSAFRVGPRFIRVDARELEAMLTPIPSAAIGTTR